MKYNVYAISDWPESFGERIAVYEYKEFASKEAALIAGQKQYNDLEIEVEEVTE